MHVEATARLKYVSIPPRKMRLVTEMVKDMPVEEALNVLNFTPKIAARHVAKTLKSAAANALSQEGTDHLKPESLMIKSITVDEAPTAKRIRFESMGRVYRIRKRHSHLTIVVGGETDRPEAARKRRTKAEGEAEEAAPAKKKSAAKKKTAKKKTAARKSTARKSTKKNDDKPAAKKTAKKKAAGQDTDKE